METIRFVHTDLAKRLMYIAGAADAPCESCASGCIEAIMRQFTDIDWKALAETAEAWEWESPYGLDGDNMRRLLADALDLEIEGVNVRAPSPRFDGPVKLLPPIMYAPTETELE